MIDSLKNKLKQRSTIEGLVYVGASLVMLFTPEYIDKIIEYGLMTLGVSRITKKE